MKNARQAVRIETHVLYMLCVKHKGPEQLDETGVNSVLMLTCIPKDEV
jgi:hypothetical protein